MIRCLRLWGRAILFQSCPCHSECGLWNDARGGEGGFHSPQAPPGVGNPRDAVLCLRNCPPQVRSILVQVPRLCACQGCCPHSSLSLARAWEGRKSRRGGRRPTLFLIPQGPNMHTCNWKLYICKMHAHVCLDKCVHVCARHLQPQVVGWRPSTSRCLI